MAAVEDRLVIEYVPINQLRPFGGNPRKISEKGLHKLKRSVEEFGFVNPILVQKGTNIIIAGHQRLKAAQAAGLTEVPVVWLDMDDVTAKAYNIADNRLQDEAEWDFTPLADLLTELDTGAFDLTLTGFDTDELERMMNYTPVGEVQEDEAPEPPEESVTKPGDIWQLGKHRVMCGDSTSADDVHRLIGDGGVDCLLTDPPYCSGGFQEAGRSAGSIGTNGKTKWGGKLPNISNDTLSTRGYQLLIKSVFKRWPAHACYVCTDWRMWVNLFDVAEASGYRVRQMLVWDKGNPGMGVGWRAQHELLLFGVRRPVKFDNHKALGNVIACKRTGNPDHPTQKPVELIGKVMEVSDWADTFGDPFLGSGTTLIAAEQLGRTCYGMEIDPRYCDVTVKRWEQLTGKHAELVQNQ